MSLNKINTDRDLLKTCFHESGHYVIAKFLKFKTVELSIEIKSTPEIHFRYDGGSEITLPMSISSEEDLLSYLKRRVQILYAGAIAESLSNRKVNDEEAKNNIGQPKCQIDHSKSRELIHLIRNVSYKGVFNEEEIQEQLDKIFETLWNETINLVERKSYDIEHIANKLASLVIKCNVRYKLTEDEINKLFQ
jgi:hypothetical protein